MVSSRVSHEALNRIETIVNLAYLIREEAIDPEQVRLHASQLEDEAVALGQFLRSVTRELKEAGR